MAGSRYSCVPCRVVLPGPKTNYFFWLIIYKQLIKVYSTDFFQLHYIRHGPVGVDRRSLDKKEVTKLILILKNLFGGICFDNKVKFISIKPIH